MHQHAQGNFVPGYENVNFFVCNFSQFFYYTPTHREKRGGRYNKINFYCAHHIMQLRLNFSRTC